MAKIIYLERQLRAGKHPTELGAVKIGAGIQKTAYRILDYVVKENTGALCNEANKKPPVAKYGARLARQYKAGHWVIQEFVTPLYKFSEEDYPDQWRKHHIMRQELQFDRPLETRYDLHEGNMGISTNGELVVFDW